MLLTSLAALLLGSWQALLSSGHSALSCAQWLGGTTSATVSSGFQALAGGTHRVISAAAAATLNSGQRASHSALWLAGAAKNAVSNALQAAVSGGSAMLSAAAPLLFWCAQALMTGLVAYLLLYGVLWILVAIKARVAQRRRVAPCISPSKSAANTRILEPDSLSAQPAGSAAQGSIQRASQLPADGNHGHLSKFSIVSCLPPSALRALWQQNPMEICAGCAKRQDGRTPADGYKRSGGAVNLRPCPGCSTVCYCSADCLASHWPSHMLVCRAACKGAVLAAAAAQSQQH